MITETPLTGFTWRDPMSGIEKRATFTKDGWDLVIESDRGSVAVPYISIDACIRALESLKRITDE